MELVRLCPLRVATLVWQPAPGERSLTVCVKATYALAHGKEAVLASQQEDAADDRAWDASPQATLYAPSDFVPFKPRADVMLVGHARAPGGVPVDSLPVRLRVGDFSKGLRITGDRAWANGPEGMRAGPTAPFVEMPLRYERGVRRGENLVGLDPSPHKQEAGRPLPNIDVTDTRTPGFGPLPPRWRARLHTLGEPALAWAQSLRSSPSPAPPGFDFGFFNAAPRDQQIDALSPATTLFLENLLPDHPRFETRLPPLRPRVFRVDPRTGLAAELALRCDTLWIDCDRALAVLSWRGVTPLDPTEAQAAGQVVVLMETSGEAKGDVADAAPPPSIAPPSVAPPSIASPPSIAPPLVAPAPSAAKAPVALPPSPAKAPSVAPPPSVGRPPSVAPLPPIARSPSATPPPVLPLRPAVPAVARPARATAEIGDEGAKLTKAPAPSAPAGDPADPFSEETTETSAPPDLPPEGAAPEEAPT